MIRTPFLGLLLLASPVTAQVPPAELGARYVPAPWWMREPVIASTGLVRTELPANRASFDARFTAIDRSSDKALESAAAKARAIDGALRRIGADRVRITTTFDTQPLYEQYRDKEGNFQSNDRADKIDRYAVTARLVVEVRDMAVLEPVYSEVVAAHPEAIGAVSFRLEPENATRTWLQTEAVKDAARRASQAADAAGSRLGAVKVIDPSGRACQTDVLASWSANQRRAEQRTDVQYAMSSPVAVTGARRAAEPSPVVISLQPPQISLDDDACVVYGLQ